MKCLGLSVMSPALIVKNLILCDMIKESCENELVFRWIKVVTLGVAGMYLLWCCSVVRRSFLMHEPPAVNYSVSARPQTSEATIEVALRKEP